MIRQPYTELHSSDSQSYIYSPTEGQWQVWIRGMHWDTMKTRQHARELIRALKAIPEDSLQARHWAVHLEIYKGRKK